MAQYPGYIASIVDELNQRSDGRPFGELQKLRQSLKNLGRLPARHPFRAETIHETYAHHYGGRTEIQFNIGEEPDNRLRHGLAFSFELSQTLPDIEILVPKVARFNEFLRVNPDLFGDMLMWHWNGPDRSPGEQRLAPIPDELVRKGFFVFLGKMQPKDGPDFDLILSDFDRLLDLYKFVEGNDAFPNTSRSSGSFTFRSGHREPLPSTTRSNPARELDVNLRHGEIQTSLFNHLVSMHGGLNVGSEVPTPSGSIDVVVKLNEGYIHFEIKTGLSARACIREGLSQALEYSYWPGSEAAQNIVIVGEPALDDSAARYMQTLREQFSLPISYQQFDMAAGTLVA